MPLSTRILRRQSNRRHVAIASHVPQHFDVHLAAAHTIRQVLGDQGSIQIFASTPLRHEFQEVVDSLGLYQAIRRPVKFMDAMRYTSLSQEEPREIIDLELAKSFNMNRWSDELLAAWDGHPPDHKFKVVCIVHNFRTTNRQRHITPWAAQGASWLLPIGYHPSPELYTALYEYVDIDVHAPLLGLPEYGVRRKREVPSHAVIQGNFQVDRRDYPNIFRDLLEALKSEPEVWGYQPLGNDEDVYKPLPNSRYEPFELHLIGEGHLDIPRALSNIVFIHNGLSYVDFFALMQSMDVVIPAFVNKDSYDFQASSTVAMAVQCNVPILASQRMRTAYGYIDDDRVTIVRPQALREVHAIGVLRRGSISHLNITSLSISQGYGLERYEEDVRRLVESSWRRSKEGFWRFKRELWEKNREAVWRVLNDLPGEI